MSCVLPKIEKIMKTSFGERPVAAVSPARPWLDCAVRTVQWGVVMSDERRGEGTARIESSVVKSLLVAWLFKNSRYHQSDKSDIDSKQLGVTEWGTQGDDQCANFRFKRC